MAKKPRTNVQLVTHMMEYSAVGALKRGYYSTCCSLASHRCGQGYSIRF